MITTALLLGLLGSIHCIGMCGPIAFMLPVDRNNQVKQFFQVISYHLGRLTSYSFIGLVFGFLGRGFQLFDFQQHLSIATGSLMIILVLFPGIVKKLKINGVIIRFISRVKNRLGQELTNKKNDTFFTIGFLNGFLPCGLLYMAILGAIATHHILLGSLYMFLFGLGTIPLMSLIVYSGNISNNFIKQKLQRFIPFVIIIIGTLFIIRGLGLNIPYVSPQIMVSDLIENKVVCK